MENLMNVEDECQYCVEHAKVEGQVSMIESKEVETALKHVKSGK